MKAKYFKINPHECFPEANYTIWLDGTFQMAIPPIDALSRWLSYEDIAIIAHPERHCIFEEAQVCIDQKKDNPAVLLEQINKYRNDGYPINNGLVAGGVLLRRHTERIKQLNAAWWKEILNHSIRDQISFNYVAHKLGVDYAVIPGSLWHNRYFPYTPHAKNIP